MPRAGRSGILDRHVCLPSDAGILSDRGGGAGGDMPGRPCRPARCTRAVGGWREAGPAAGGRRQAAGGGRRAAANSSPVVLGKSFTPRSVAPRRRIWTFSVT
ncbi:hypothetical protein TPA0906_72920 [Streptomyces olivaceus]|nr:hypothetical protein TPA0906_72920 [Streptomyces olivaceus]